MIDDIYHFLKDHGFCCMTVRENEGTGQFTDQSLEFPILTHPFLHAKMGKIEIFAKAENVDRIVTLIHEYGHTGERGDGLIYVSPVDNVYGVRNLKQGEEVLGNKMNSN